MPLSPEQSFTEAQARAIFEEAARRQAARQTADAPGLTLAELQAVAREAGLDPDLVAAAAAHIAIEPPEPAKRYPFWDLPDELRVERVIPGEVPDALWETMVAELRRTFGQAGRAGQVGRVREWATEVASSSGSNLHAPVRVEVRPEDGQTRIVLSQSMKAYRDASYGVSGSFLAMGLLLFPILILTARPDNLGAALLFCALLTVGGVAGGLAIRHAARKRFRSQTDTFETLLDRLDLLALRLPRTETPAAPEAASSETPRLDASLLDAPTTEAEPSRPSARTRA